jgi:hypothetical protein
MGGAGGEQVQTTEPWDQAKPHIREFMDRARGFLDDPNQMYPGQMFTGPGQTTGRALDRARGFADLNTADDLRAFAGEAMGGFASNPMLDQTFDAAAEGITRNFQRVTQPGIESAFARAGRGASSASGRAVGAAQGELSDSLGDLASQFYYADYENRMGDRFRGASLLGEADRMEAGQIGVLGSAGAQEDAYSQQALDELIGRFNFGQQDEQNRLDQFGQRVGAITNGYSTTSTTGMPSGGSPGLSIGLGLMSALATVFSGGTAAAPMAALMAGGGLAGGLMGGGGGNGTAAFASGRGRMAPMGGF